MEFALGMQLLFNRSEEGNEDGLGLIDGEVKKIKQINDLKIPHMGWNETYFPVKTSTFKNVKNKSFLLCSTVMNACLQMKT